MGKIVARTPASLLACALALGACAPLAAAAGTIPGIVLPDCGGKPATRPTQVYLACGDGSAVADHLVWTGWGEPFAAARGTIEVNLCQPDCAEGTYAKIRGVVIADGRGHCPDGRPAYAEVTYAFLDRPPFRMNDTAQVVPLPCVPRH